MGYLVGGYGARSGTMPGGKGSSRRRSRKPRKSAARPRGGKKKGRHGRKLKFGSAAYRAKYLGHGKRKRRG